jgi:hypothetical protein
MCVAGTVAGRADAIGSVIVRRLGRDSSARGVMSSEQELVALVSPA